MVCGCVCLLAGPPTLLEAQQHDTLFGAPAPPKADSTTPSRGTDSLSVVSGVRLPAPPELARGLTGRTATLTADEVEARGVNSLAEAMDQLPGVTTSEEFDVTVRGFSVSPGIGIPQGVTVYIDGVRANEPDAHEVNFDLLPIEDVEHVDVVYGPSVLLGRNSLGAAVNLVTRRGGPGVEQEAEVAGGTFGRYELRAQMGGGGGPSPWDYYAGVHYEHSGGWREETESRVTTVFGKLGLRQGKWDGTLSYSGAFNRLKQAGSLPESLFYANPRLNFTQGDYFAPIAHLVTLNAQRPVSQSLRLAVNGFARSIDSDQFNANFVGLDSRQRNAARQFGGAAQLSGRVQLGGREIRLLGGVDGDYLNTNVRIYAIPPGEPDSLTEWITTDQVDLGLFAGANMPLVAHLSATAAARFDWIHLPLQDQLEPSQSGLNTYHQVSPRLGLTWSSDRPRRVQEFYAAISRGFRSPALVEVGCSNPDAACPLPFALGSDPPLKPVVATTYELGWRTRRHGVTGFDASASVYRTDVRDDIFFVASTVTAGYFQNIGATRRSGVEVTASWSLPAGIQLYANYGYGTATFQTTATLATTRDTAGEVVHPGDWLPMVPDHRANAGAWIPVRRARSAGEAEIALGIDGRYVGQQWFRGDEANVTSELPDYAVMDATLIVRLREIQIRTAVRNLLNLRYANFGTYAENPTVPGSPVQRWLTPGLPRTVEVSITREF